MRRVQVLWVVSVMALCAGFPIPAHAQTQPAPQAADATPFAGKVVTVYILHEPEYSVTMRDVSVVQVGERAFLRGTVIEEDDNWRSGKLNLVAVEHITEITVFNSLEEYLESVEKYDEVENFQASC